MATPEVNDDSFDIDDGKPEHYSMPHIVSIDSTLVDVTVGPEREVYQVLKALLCRSSHAFAAALQGPYLESDGGNLKLSDTECDTWETYMDWLYRGTTACRTMLADGASILRAIDLYIFADKYSVPRLKRDILDELQGIHCLCEFGKEEIFKVYKYLPPQSALCRLVVEYHLTSMRGQNWQDFWEFHENLPSMFIMQTMFRLVGLMGPDFWGNLMYV